MLRGVLALLFALLLLSWSSDAVASESKAILLVHTYGYEAPFRFPFDSAFARTLREAGFHVDLYIETIDPNRFPGDEYARLTRAYLRQKYADKKLAVVAVVWDRALTFLRDEQEPLFEGVPMVAALTSLPRAPIKNTALLWSGNTLAETVAAALRIHPQATQIVHIDSVPPGEGSGAVTDESVRQLELVTSTVPITYLRELPLDQVLARVATLPPDTIVLVTRQTIGRGGQPIATSDAVGEVAQASRVPVYVTNEQQIGSGAVGGVAISVEASAIQLAKTALRIADTGSVPEGITQQALVPMFDWRQLQRWRINENLLPAGSLVLFRQQDVWSQYRLVILGTALIVALQTALITGLVVQRARRRRTDQALRESEQQLRESSELNQDLAGRLLSALEDERSRIARDLHDDVGQQLVGVALVLGDIKRRISRTELQADYDESFTDLQNRTSALVQTVRNLSHDLHPAVLEHAGLAAALQDYGAEVTKHQNLTVVVEAEDTLDGLSADVALCLYRVAQEAIINAVRHASAKTVRVRLTAPPDAVELLVADDGIGFSTGEHTRSGLGLRSIEERVRVRKGLVSLASRPGQGTTLFVRIPIPTS
jgi:signal transduction histidine kinase